MKKIQVLFAAIALLTATVGVFATAMIDVATTHYIDNPNITPENQCDIVVTELCPAGDAVQCDVSSAGNGMLVFVKDPQDPTSQCAPFLRAE